MMASSGGDDRQVLEYESPAKQEEPSHKFAVMLYFSVIMLLVAAGMILLVVNAFRFLLA